MNGTLRRPHPVEADPAVQRCELRPSGFATTIRTLFGVALAAGLMLGAAPLAYGRGGGGGGHGGGGHGGGGHGGGMHMGGGGMHLGGSAMHSGGGRSFSMPSGGGRGFSMPSGGGRPFATPSGGGRAFSMPSGGMSRGANAASNFHSGMGGANAFRSGPATHHSAFLSSHGAGRGSNFASGPGLNRGAFASGVHNNFTGRSFAAYNAGRSNFLNNHPVNWNGSHSFARQWNAGPAANNFAGKWGHNVNNWNNSNWRNWNGGWRNGGLGHRYWPYYNRSSYGYWGNRFFGWGFFNPFWWGWNTWPYYFPRYGGACWPYFAYTPSLSYGSYYSAYPPTTVVGTDVVPTDDYRTTPQATTDPSTTSDAATSGEFSGLGEQAFRSGDYAGAVKYWRHALVDDPQNGVLVLMLSQALFADGKFDEAAGAVQQGMLMLPEDKWGVVVENFAELYGPGSDYSMQIKALEKARTAAPDNPALRFLLGYQYGYLDYPANAVAELEKAVALSPDDQVAVKLRDVMKARAAKAKGSP